MLSKVNTATIHGIEGQLISVETDIANGLPVFNIVGQPDNSIKEAKARIRAAIINSGVDYPRTRITVNMSPAGIRKRGSHFDLAIAIGILASSGQLKYDELDKYCFIGELSLDGSLGRTDGILPMVIALRNQGFTKIVVPRANEKEAALIKDIDIFAVCSLQEIINHLNFGAELSRAGIKTLERNRNRNYRMDFADVKGQEAAKRAITISVAGGHGLLMIGNPSTGKTMLAERIPTIMPEMNYEEILETTMIYSISGQLSKERPYINERPFRRPHHRITPAALLGGGAYPMPGEISLADKGVLFLDELAEFDRNTIESLRIPLETKEIQLNRKEWSCRYPADFLLVAASNPCKCGYFRDRNHKCVCTDNEVRNYMKKLSGPILDRIDMNFFLHPVSYEDMSDTKALTSEEMKNQILMAREIQRQRYKDNGIILNSQMDAKMIQKYVSFQSYSDYEFMHEAYAFLNLNPRTMQKSLKVARTIADLEGAETVEKRHLSESLQYRGEGLWMDI